MQQASDSGGTATKIRKSQKDEIIRNAEHDLLIEKISVIEFLNRVTHKPNKIAIDMSHFETINTDCDDADDFDIDSTNIHNLSIEQRNSNEANSCIICCNAVPNVLFLPCRHLKCCDACASEMAVRASERYKCPLCKRIVEDTVVAFV